MTKAATQRCINIPLQLQPQIHIWRQRQMNSFYTLFSMQVHIMLMMSFSVVNFLWKCKIWGFLRMVWKFASYWKEWYEHVASWMMINSNPRKGILCQSTMMIFAVTAGCLWAYLTCNHEISVYILYLYNLCSNFKKWNLALNWVLYAIGDIWL